MAKGPEQIPNIYSEKSFQQQQDKSRRWHRKVIPRLLVVVFVLFLIRFLNVGAIYYFTSLELRSDPNLSVDRYVFLGIAGRDEAAERLQSRYIDVRRGDLVAVCHTNLLNPFMVTIRNDRERTLVDLGRLAVMVERGMVSIDVTTWGQVSITASDQKSSQLFEPWLLGPLVSSWLSPGNRKAGGSRDTQVSFALRPLVGSRQLKIPILVYFYLPLIMILVMARWYGAGFYTAFLYYLGFFLLFDFRTYLVEVPFSWLWNIFGIELTRGLTLIVSLAMLTVILSLSMFGLSRWKRMDNRYWGRPWVWMLSFLPFFLRF